MTISETKAEFLRAHFARQRDIHERAVQATSKLAQVNEELILRTGLSQLSERRMKEIVGEKQIQEIKQLAGMVADGEVDKDKHDSPATG